LYFVLSKELRGNRIVVEIWAGRELVGVIYPHETTVTVVSKYLEDAKLDKNFPPMAIITFRR
jgi:hypothetical protein